LVFCDVLSTVIVVVVEFTRDAFSDERPILFLLFLFLFLLLLILFEIETVGGLNASAATGITESAV
jgi:hypothetical protein